MADVASDIKDCTKCGSCKPLDSFYRMAANKRDGRGPWCKSCMDAKRRANAAENKERERKWRANYEKSHPEIKGNYILDSHGN